MSKELASGKLWGYVDYKVEVRADGKVGVGIELDAVKLGDEQTAKSTNKVDDFVWTILKGILLAQVAAPPAAPQA